MTKLEKIINVCETCDEILIHQILENVCGEYISPHDIVKDRTTYVDMIEGTLINDNPIRTEELYTALQKLNEL